MNAASYRNQQGLFPVIPAADYRGVAGLPWGASTSRDMSLMAGGIPKDYSGEETIGETGMGRRAGENFGHEPRGEAW